MARLLLLLIKPLKFIIKLTLPIIIIGQLSLYIIGYLIFSDNEKGFYYAGIVSLFLIPLIIKAEIVWIIYLICRKRNKKRAYAMKLKYAHHGYYI